MSLAFIMKKKSKFHEISCRISILGMSWLHEMGPLQ